MSFVHFRIKNIKTRKNFFKLYLNEIKTKYTMKKPTKNILG